MPSRNCSLGASGQRASRLGAVLLLAHAGIASCSVRADLGGPGAALTGAGAGGEGAAEAGPDTPEDAGSDVAVDHATADVAPPDVDASPGADASPDADASPEDAASEPAPDAPGETGPVISCADNLTNGDETDVDCGGSCPACGLGQQCAANSDCGFWPGCNPFAGCACDLVTKTCVYDHCSDQRTDEGESDVDCGGGECAGCALTEACVLDSDCSATLPGCDAALGGCFCDWPARTCVANHCIDHKEDASETALDCGGLHCAGCALGEACETNFDCASNACDALTLECVADACADHHVDGTETDVDCGGSTCGGCGIGKKCVTSSDCAVGTCAPGIPPVCL